MHIIATSDLHGTLPEIPACDLLIVAGDVCPVWDHNRAFQAKWLREVFAEWMRNCLETGVKQIVWTPGNHDFVLEDSFKLRAEMKRVEPNIHFLIDESVKIDDLRIYCTPWTPHLPNWAFAAEEDEAEKHFDLIPPNLDILVSHGPPTGYGDRVSHAGHVGCDALLTAIKYKQPRNVVCGHIHEGFGGYPTSYGGYLHNVSYLDEFYEPTHKLVELLGEKTANEQADRAGLEPTRQR